MLIPCNHGFALLTPNPFRANPVVAKQGTTLRLSDSIQRKLSNVSRITSKSKSQLAEEAFDMYFKAIGLDFDHGYTLTITPKNAVLQQVGSDPRILEVVERNGQSPDELRKHYQVKLKDPVKLIVQEE